MLGGSEATRRIQSSCGPEHGETPWMHSPMVCTALIAVSNPLVSSKPIRKRNGRLPRVDFDFSYAWMGVFALDTCQRDVKLKTGYILNLVWAVNPSCFLLSI